MAGAATVAPLLERPVARDYVGAAFVRLGNEYVQAVLIDVELDQLTGEPMPRVLRVWKRVDGPLFGGAIEPEDGSWLSVIALNVGVGLVWASAVITTPGGDAVVTLLGYGLIAVAWVPFLRRVWPALVY